MLHQKTMELIHVQSALCPEGQMMKSRAESIDAPRSGFGTCLAKTDVHAPIGPCGVAGVFHAREAQGSEHELIRNRPSAGGRSR